MTAESVVLLMLFVAAGSSLLTLGLVVFDGLLAALADRALDVARVIRRWWSGPPPPPRCRHGHDLIDCVRCLECAMRIYREKYLNPGDKR